MINILDSLKINKTFIIGIEDIEVLMNLYRPIIGIDTIKVYLALIYANKPTYLLSEILKDNDLEVYEFNKYKQALEELELIYTYESNNLNDICKFILEIEKPNPKRLLSNQVILNKLKSRVDENTYLSLLNKYSLNYGIPEGYRDVSASMVLKREDLREQLYNGTVVKKEVYTKSVVYDMKALLSDPNIRNSSLYPVISTESSVSKISKIMDIAGITPEMFRTKVLINFVGDKIIDFDRLKISCLNVKETMKFDVNKGYLNPTAVFLKHLYGFEPEFYDKRLADAVYRKYEFGIDVLNYIFEYCLDANDKRINSNYVNRVATTLKLKGITTITAAKEALNLKKGIEFKGIEEKDHLQVKIDSNSIESELADILKKRYEH